MGIQICSDQGAGLRGKKGEILTNL